MAIAPVSPKAERIVPGNAPFESADEIAAKAVWQDVFFSSQDNLRLYARDYPQTEGPRVTPILCLAGLARNSKDFHALARTLAPRRRVITMDYRGRGRSEYAEDWSTYTPLQEMNDASTLLTILGVHECIVLGTSRGGIIAMLMAALRPTAIRGVILNDVGPEIEPRGLLRIKGYLGQGNEPLSWTEAAYMLRQTNRGFVGLSEEDWLAWAKRTYRGVNDKPQSDYDFNLKKNFASHEDLTEGLIPTLWPQFKALKRKPVMVLRGENSDILTPETVAKMLEMKPDLISETIPGRGHVPFLDEPESEAAITDFLLRFGAAEHD